MNDYLHKRQQGRHVLFASGKLNRKQPQVREQREDKAIER